ncbi:MAG: hypothetical protein R2708_18565 [Vicinamibacterales bacterium]
MPAALACVLTAAAGLAGTPSRAEAQRVLLSPAIWSGVPPATEAWDLATRSLLWRIPVAFGDQSAVFTSDGRFVVARPSDTNGQVLRVMDTETRAFLDIVTDFRPRIAHPSDIAVFGIAAWQTLPSGRTAGAVTRLDPGGLHTFDVCPGQTARTVDLTLDGGALLALCDSGEIVVADAATGTVQRTVAGPAGAGAMSMRATADGTAAYLLANTLDAPLLVVDTTTGAVVTTIAAPAGCLSSLGMTSSDRTLVFVHCTDYYGVPGSPTSRVFVYDTTTETFSQHGGGYSPLGLAPDNTRLLLRTLTLPRLGAPAQGTLSETDLASSSQLWVVPFLGYAAISYPPLAPVLQATVTGTQVDLAWTLAAPSPGASGHTLEIGSGPGLSDVGTVALGAAASVRVSGAPSGTCFVRVRAANASGAGPPRTRCASRCRSLRRSASRARRPAARPAAPAAHRRRCPGGAAVSVSSARPHGHRHRHRVPAHLRARRLRLRFGTDPVAAAGGAGLEPRRGGSAIASTPPA